MGGGGPSALPPSLRSRPTASAPSAADDEEELRAGRFEKGDSNAHLTQEGQLDAMLCIVEQAGRAPVRKGGGQVDGLGQER